MIRKRGKQLALSVALGLSVGIPCAWGRWRAGEPVPIARLLKNVGAYVRAHPKDAQGFYTEGRLHSLAFANDADRGRTPDADAQTVPVYGDERSSASGSANTLPGLPGYLSITQGQTTPAAHGKGVTLSTSARQHLRASIAAYEQAVKLTPKEPLYQLGLGFMYEQAARFPGSLAPKVTDKTVRTRALTWYRRAYAAKRMEELAQEHFGPGGDIISLEAGQGILRLLARGKPTPEETKEAAQVRADVKELEAKPRAITPVLIAFQPRANLPDLLRPGSRVAFDLAGDGSKQSWPWVKPTTGILVWDPSQSGKVISGRQLFGSVTWWMFWRDGYQPLAALDDNGDGMLRGRELRGLAVWFDRNGNGVSDPGEVIPARQVGIVGIATRANETENGVPAHRAGVLLRDGSTAATFDWTPEPLAAKEREKPQ